MEQKTHKELYIQLITRSLHACGKQLKIKLVAVLDRVEVLSIEE